MKKLKIKQNCHQFHHLVAITKNILTAHPFMHYFMYKHAHMQFSMNVRSQTCSYNPFLEYMKKKKSICRIICSMLPNCIDDFDNFFKSWMNICISFHSFIHSFTQVAFTESSQLILGFRDLVSLKIWSCLSDAHRLVGKKTLANGWLWHSRQR